MGEVFGEVSAVVQLIAGLAAIFGVFATAKTLGTRARIHADTQKWIGIKEAGAGSENLPIFQRIIDSNIARLISIREVPTSRIVLHLVIMLYVIIGVPLMAKGSLDLYFQYSDRVAPRFIDRVIETDYIPNLLFAGTVMSYAALALTRLRLYRAKVYLNCNNSRMRYDSDRPSVVIRTGSIWLSGIIAAIAVPAGWGGLSWITANQINDHETRISDTDSIFLLASIFLFAVGLIGAALSSRRISDLTAHKFTEVESPEEEERRDYIRSEVARRAKRRKRQLGSTTSDARVTYSGTFILESHKDMQIER